MYNWMNCQHKVSEMWPKCVFTRYVN